MKSLSSWGLALQRTTASLMLIIVVLFSICSTAIHGVENTVYAEQVVSVTYFLYDAVKILYVDNRSGNVSGKAYLETAINYSDSNYRQEVIVWSSANTSRELVDNTTAHSVKVSNGTTAFVQLLVKVYARVITSSEVKKANPSKSELEVYKNLTYLSRHEKELAEKVVKDFEEWLRNRNINISTLTLGELTYYASLFVYKYYIKYSASALPRSLDEVIEKREGDCDDMSRVLSLILRYYGIPTMIEYAYIYVEGYRFGVTIGKSYIVFENNGPHAYTLAYLGKDIGWVPLDLIGITRDDPITYSSRSLAIALIVGHSYNITVNMTSVKEYVQFSTLVQYVEVIGVSKKPLSGEQILEKLDRALNEYLTKTSTITTTTTTFTTTPISTSTLISATPTQTTLITNTSTASTPLLEFKDDMVKGIIVITSLCIVIAIVITAIRKR